ncbi:MAG: NHLP family bacteriocin export ABC transporter peptidase/permease/ATPase subunit [Syntrophobacteraceae bacterium CG2_30_61_12]|nr:MAG: NHLP family bacteriocin export ABC transporter peptidase/permease/ATPase subunit [Syntrophobacteraceae bacterium CG2_30_61_12]
MTRSGKVRRVPTVLQMEPNEAGAAALAMVLGAYGRFVPMEEMRGACGVTRDGVKPEYLLRAARAYGLEAELREIPAAEALRLEPPFIAPIDFGRYVVVEGLRSGRVHLRDPETGPRVLPWKEFEQVYDGLALRFRPSPTFTTAGQPWSFSRGLGTRLAGGRMALVYVVLAGLFLVVPGLAIPTFSKIFVDEILVGGLDRWLAPLLLAMGLTALLHGALNWLQKFYLLRLETKLALSLSARFFDHVFRLPIEFFQRRYGGEIVSRVMINDQVAQLLSRELAVTALAAVMIVFYALLMLRYDVVLTLAGIAVVTFNLFVLRLFSRRRTDLVHRLLQDQGKSLATAMTGLQMIETLKANGAESEFFSQWVGYQAKVKNAEQELGAASQALAVIPPLLTGLNNVLVLALGALRIMEGEMSVGGLVAFQSLMFSFVGPFNQLVGLGARLQELKSGIWRLDDVLAAATDPGLEHPAEGGPETAPGAAPEAGKLSGEVELNNLTFGYNRMEPPLIDRFSLTLRPGSRVALVGRSGSGKSTVAKLVTGLYRPWSGSIRFDGRPAAEIPRAVRTHSIALVDQDIFMFEGTIRDNLTLWDQTVPAADLVQAGLDACIHEDIAERPGGYDSKVAEGCGNFSGGQRQRLEIARALVNRPAILVLDEATSALDAHTEKRVDENLRRRGLTCLIVAHRLSTIRDCDEIIVLEHGRVVERGTHETMKNAGGPYAALIAAE